MPFAIGTYVRSTHAREWHAGLVGVVVATFDGDYDIYFFGHERRGHNGSGQAFTDLDGLMMRDPYGHYWIPQDNNYLVLYQHSKAHSYKAKEWPPKKKTMYKNITSANI